jgi:hypothetical protein
VLDDTFAHGEGQIESAERRVPLFEPGDDPQSVQVVVEAETVLTQSFIESFFAGVAEGRMADVVREGESFGELGVEAEGSGDGAGDLGDFEGVGEPAAEVIGGELSGEAGEDLRFSGKAAEGASVEDSGSVSREE